MKGFAERLERLGPRYNALALPLTKMAEKRAKEVDDELKRERYRGPLQGIPFGAKDLLSLEGHPTTWGAKPYAAQVFPTTATVLQKLDKTGSVLIGKLAMVELAGGGGYRTAAGFHVRAGTEPVGHDAVVGRFFQRLGDSGRGGTGSVCDRLGDLGVDLEPVGVLRGHRAAADLRAGEPGGRRWRSRGPWTSSARSAAARTIAGWYWQAIAGGEKSFYYTPQYARPLTDLTVGFAPDDLAWADADSMPALRAAMQVVGKTGVKLKDVALPDLPYDSLADLIIGAEGASVFEPLITSGQVDQLADPTQAAALKANLGIPAKDYLRAMRIRTLLKQKFRELFADVDILVAPTRYNAAPKVADPLDGPDPTPSGQAKTPGMKSLIPAGNLAGLPALSVPCGFAGNLPVGLQFVGPAWSENSLLALGRAFQSATDWHKRRPVIT